MADPAPHRSVSRISRQTFSLTGAQQQARKRPYSAYQRFIDRFNAYSGFETVPVFPSEFLSHWLSFNRETRAQLCDLFCCDISLVAALVQQDDQPSHLRTLLAQLDNDLFNLLNRSALGQRQSS